MKGREVSREARALAEAADIFDLHLDTFIPIRLFGWDVTKRHGLGIWRGYFSGHVDLPRARDGGLKGGMWSITTNPWRTARGRWRAFGRNLDQIRKVVAGTSGAMQIARTATEYREALKKGAHGCLLAVQGGNAFDAAPESIHSVPDRLITRVTVVHLTNSALGASSLPMSFLRLDRGLTTRGKDFVRALNSARVFVDLAHIDPKSFWDAVEVHDRTQPLIVTHTGVSGVRRVWRNIDDRQIKAIADTGGTIGIIFAQVFLERRGGPRDGSMVVEHMEHVIRVAGEDFVSIGSDYDGTIIPPPGLRGGGDSYPRLVQYMLDRGWNDDRIRKVLGGNALRALGMLRP
jgi:membrane dipeptidase